MLQEVDWWGVGIIAYRMIAGHNPFEFEGDVMALNR
jgi:serine/threonine protein kinase